MLSLFALHPPCAPGLIFHHGGTTSLLRAADQSICEILVDYVNLLLNSISDRLSHRIAALILAFPPFLDWISLNLSLPLNSSILFL
jgi:hypothetical protein